MSSPKRMVAASSARKMSSAMRLFRCRERGHRRRGNAHGDVRAAALVAVDLDGAMVQADEALHDGKAEARAAVAAVAFEAVEHGLQHVLRNARSPVGDHEDEVATLAPAAEADGA